MLNLRSNPGKQWRLIQYVRPILYASGQLTDAESRELDRPYTNIGRVLVKLGYFAVLHALAAYGTIRIILGILHR